MVDRFHKAARDGYLDLLKEATRKDLNTKDEDGMTPTLWAAFEGNLDALRLIVGRGGDPDKCDNYGNTALHFSAARGHMPCVSFLVNFGVNMWALDIDFHTAKDLAAINSREEILRFLDSAVVKEEAKDPKKVKAYKEKAVKEAEKRAKEFDKLQKKATKMQEEEQKKLAKQRKEMASEGGAGSGGMGRQSLAFLSLRKDSRLIYAQSPKFSEIVANEHRGHHGGGGITSIGGTQKERKGGGVYKKVQQRKGQSQTVAGHRDDFKLSEVVNSSEGKRSVRSLSGLRRDSEVMYVPKYDINGAAKRGKIEGLFEDVEDSAPQPTTRGTFLASGTVGKRAGSISGFGLTRSISQPDYMNQVGAGGTNGSSEGSGNDPVPSIFERPGFGSVAFRNSITAQFSNLTMKEVEEEHKAFSDYSDSADDEDDFERGPVELFLAAAGLQKYIPVFAREKIDLEALMLLTEEDLKSIGIEMGPRRKLLKAIKDRESAIKQPGEVVDSRL